MAGHYPGQFGPPAGGPAPGGAAGRPPGRFGVPGRVLCCLAPLLTAGLLGIVPSLLLAVRRRRAADVIGAVLFSLVFVVFLVSIALAGGSKDPNTADTVGTVAMVLLWLGAPLHYLAMDRRALWPAPVQAPGGYFYPPVQQMQPVQQFPPGRQLPPGQPMPPVQPAWYPPQAAAPAPGSGPVPTAAEADPYALVARYQAPSAKPTPVPAPEPAGGPSAPGRSADDLQELGELLRRQSRQDRP